jgi:ribosomal protein S12 methylthiotransferase
VDSERILGKLLENNIHITLNLEEAHSIIINTCAFLQSARSESEEIIQEFIEKKKAGIIKKLIISGCYPSLDGNSLMNRFPAILSML